MGSRNVLPLQPRPNAKPIGLRRPTWLRVTCHFHVAPFELREARILRNCKAAIESFHSAFRRSKRHGAGTPRELAGGTPAETPPEDGRTPSLSVAWQYGGWWMRERVTPPKRRTRFSDARASLAGGLL